MKGRDQRYPLFCGALDRGWTHDRLCLAYEGVTIFFGDGAAATGAKRQLGFQTSTQDGCAPQSV
jgi:hypothetical protein